MQKTIEEMRLELSIIFNKGAVMVLPNGVSKATGLAAALAALDLKSEETIGVGDAENDLALLEMCGLGVAVANALDTVKAAADWMTPAARGDGVAQILNAVMTAEVQGDWSHPRIGGPLPPKTWHYGICLAAPLRLGRRENFV